MKRMLFTNMIFMLAHSLIYAKPLMFGIVPQQSATKLAKDWGPIARFLSTETKLEIRFSTAKDIPTFEKRLRSGEYDLAYMNPYHLVEFSEKPGYIAIAKQKNKRIKGIVVTHANSPLKSLNELKGQQIAFPAPAAFAASILPRAKMESMGLNITPRYVSSHDSVYKSVAKGLFPAGGGVVRTLKALDPDVQKKLRILWTTKSYTPHAFAAHPNLGNEKSKILVRALLRLNDEKNKPLLEPLKFNGIIEANDSHWDDVRALNISLLKF